VAAALVIGLTACQGERPAESRTPDGAGEQSAVQPTEREPAGEPDPVEPSAAPDPIPDNTVPTAAAPELPDEPADPPPAVSDEAPFETGDVPALPMDEAAALLVSLEGMEEEVPAVFHHSTLGYSIVYDSALQLHEWENGDSYAGPLEGDYLAVTTVGLATEEEAIQGLKEQNGIGGEPAVTNFGSKGYEAQTLWLEDGDLRVSYLVCCHNETVWLIELSLSGPESAEGWGPRFQAMLDTIEFL